MEYGMSDQDGMISLLVDRFDRFEQRTQTQLDRMADALELLARVDATQSEQRASIDRAFAGIRECKEGHQKADDKMSVRVGVLEKKVHEIDREQPSLITVRGIIISALVAGCGMLIVMVIR